MHGCTQSACFHAGFPTPTITQWATLEGCTAVALMSEYDDTRQASRQCARTCGALTPVRKACLWRAQQAVPTSTDPMGFSRIRESSRYQAQTRNTPVKCEAASAILASEGPAPVSVGRQNALVPGKCVERRSVTCPADSVMSVCCFVLLNRYWGIVTVPGSIPYGSRPGVPDPHPSP